MNIRKACIWRVWFQAINLAFIFNIFLSPQHSHAANLQTQDVFFFSTHKRPMQIVGDSKNAFILTEGGVLLYDYRRSAWVDNLAPGLTVNAIRYSPSRSRFFLQLQGGRILEYNTTFRRLNDAPQSDFDIASDEGAAADLNGVTLEGNDLFMGDMIRDRYMRRIPITLSKVFEYDNLWILTHGAGLYYGSLRRKQAAPFWFGLADKNAQVVYPEGGNIWYGSCKTNLAATSGIESQSNGALVKSKSDLSTWKVYLAQLESGFNEGCIHDILAWKDFIWLATEKGVIRHDPRSGQFISYSHLLGGNFVRVNSLHVHDGALYAATQEGVAYLSDPQGEFQSMGSLIQGGIVVNELISKDKDLWAATRYGLFVHQVDGWKDLKTVSGKDVPEAMGINVPSVAYHDSSLYWISGNKVMIKPKKQLPKVMLERDQPFRIRFEGDMMFLGYYSGVLVYDLNRKLWTDFTLKDGIPGTRVQTFALDGGKLWIGTDEGVERLNYKPYLP